MDIERGICGVCLLPTKRMYNGLYGQGGTWVHLDRLEVVLLQAVKLGARPSHDVPTFRRFKLGSDPIT